jgi:gamma-glutamyltranspeptidase / glutathione hydrolase
LKGAVAGGSTLTTDAGLFALSLGGNAVDAAVAAQLCACVAEPLLTGLGGGGLATIRFGGRTQVCDFFSDAPSGRAPMTSVELDFGPAKQTFHVGPGSITVPGLPAGLWAMHQRWGRIPMERLVKPAVEATRGVPVSAAFARVNELLWPIQQLTPQASALFGRDGSPLVEGDTFHNPDLADTLLDFARNGPESFRTGRVAQLLLEASETLTPHDLTNYAPAFREALAVPYRGGTVYLPAEPSQGGIQVARSLQLLAEGPMPAPFGFDHVERLAGAMDEAEVTGELAELLYRPGFRREYLGSGYTTHLSTVDGDGNAVAITSSLGETAGIVLGDTGVCPNNFLGEEDVNPPDYDTPVGRRLITMCCPTVLTHNGAVYALGSGGSSRIRSALLHGVVYLVDHKLDPGSVPGLPRCHMQDGVLRLESFDRPPHLVEELRGEHPELVIFDRRGMYFGGLHIAGLAPRGFVGGGDARRSGDFQLYTG